MDSWSEFLQLINKMEPNGHNSDVKNNTADHLTLSDRESIDHSIRDEELGQENVELVDSEWADFEHALRYILYRFGQHFQVHR